MSSNTPLSQQWHEAAYRWLDLDSAARLLEDTKSAVFAQMTTSLGDIPVNRAEQTIKASAGWHTHIEKITRAKTAANRARIEMEYLKMRLTEWQSAEANHRSQARL